MNRNALLKLENRIQNYAWGSTSAIPEILGFTNKENLPMAELWMGSHPKAPSLTPSGPLDELIRRDPSGFLGSAAASRFSGTLPFLFKVLAAGMPLSIQAHPSREQAKEGFARENRLGIPLDADIRNYKDDNHKPEILCALTPFTALWGFRSSGEIRAELESFVSPAALGLRAALKESPESMALRSFFQILMNLNTVSLNTLLEELKASLPGKEELRYRWVKTFFELYPGDPGILSALYLNLLVLNPGEAIFIPAGELHAYLKGTGIELMANSDNVLRGGLTPKHVDIPELLSVLAFEPRRPVFVEPRRQGPVTVFSVPAKEFFLSRIDVPGQGYSRKPAGPEVLICFEGRGILENSEGALDYHKGDSFFLPASAGDVRFTGPGVFWAAGVPL